MSVVVVGVQWEHGACLEPGLLLESTGEAWMGGAVEAVMYDK